MCIEGLHCRVPVPSGTRQRTARSHPGEITDVSISGLFLRPSAEWAPDVRPGTWIRVFIYLPDRKKPMNVCGEIRWARNDGFGIEFDWLNPELSHLVAAN